MPNFKILACLLFSPLIVNAQIVYPVTKKKPIINIYHGVEVVDDYQWLENLGDDAVFDWVKSQNRVSLKYLRKLVRKTGAEGKMNKYMYRKTGGYKGKEKYEYDDDVFFRLYFTGSSSSPSLFYRKGYAYDYSVLVNSNFISSKDHIGITYYKTSKNKNLLAYQYNRNGSDWKEIRVVKIDKKRHYNDVLTQTKSPEIYWLNQGFFYEKYPFDSLTATYKKPEIMYHSVGTKQDNDRLVFKTPNEDETLDFFGSKDEKLFIIKKENLKLKRFSYYILDPLKAGFAFKPFLLNTSYDLHILDFKNNQIFASTAVNDKRHIITIPLNEPKKFKVLTPTFEDAVLDEAEMMDKKIVFSYQSQTGSIIAMVDYEGNLLNYVSLPEGMAVKSIFFNKKYKQFFFYLGSYTIPRVLYSLNLDSFEYKMEEKTEVNFDTKGYKFTQQQFTTTDGAEVPIFIVYKDSLKTNGDTPFLLKTYGGYGAVETPSYNPGIVYFLEQGGAFAYVNIRGGGELGQQWKKDGQRLNKINGINDFISAAEFLIGKGYTSPKKIAITGGSHGGLITAAALTKRPELYGSAVIDVGALDMLRFENFTVGNAKINLLEFGTVTDSTDFKNLYSYSPYHHVRDDVDYPSVLIVTGDSDNRVPPLHSYKFAARMQSNSQRIKPVLLWTQEKAGHFGADNMFGLLEENAIIYSFLFHELKKN
jgi:prolyl oligopeptidase